MSGTDRHILAEKNAECSQMPPATVEALRGSIAKWEGIAAGTTKDCGYDNCPLCQRFMDVEHPETGLPCFGCPVSAVAGDWGCSNTPYEEAWAPLHRATREDNEFHGYATTPELKAAAQLEVNFLKSLLPPGEKP